MFINVPSSTNLHLEVDLPDGMNGLMDIAGGFDISVAAYGWSEFTHDLQDQFYR
jgi:hypothetical protein